MRYWKYDAARGMFTLADGERDVVEVPVEDAHDLLAFVVKLGIYDKKIMEAIKKYYFFIVQEEYERLEQKAWQLVIQLRAVLDEVENKKRECKQVLAEQVD